MDLTSELHAPCAAPELFAIVEDLASYPTWLSIVTRTVPDATVGVDNWPTWQVDLRGRLGPLARSKRLRMARTVHEAPRRVRFERFEVDGRSHADWVLEATVVADPGASRLEMHLHYGGTFGGAVLERMLRDEIERSRVRLLDLVASSSGQQDTPTAT